MLTACTFVPFLGATGWFLSSNSAAAWCVCGVGELIDCEIILVCSTKRDGGGKKCLWPGGDALGVLILARLATSLN